MQAAPPTSAPAGGQTGRQRSDAAAARNAGLYQTLQQPAQEIEQTIRDLRQRITDLNAQGGELAGPTAEADQPLQQLSDLAARITDAASVETARRLNQDLPPQTLISELHGQPTRLAKRRVMGALTALSELGRLGMPVTLDFITGQGRHSHDGMARLRSAVATYLQGQGIRYETVPGNDGVLRVRAADIPPGWSPSAPAPGMLLLAPYACQQSALRTHSINCTTLVYASGGGALQQHQAPDHGSSRVPGHTAISSKWAAADHSHHKSLPILPALLNSQSPHSHCCLILLQISDLALFRCTAGHGAGSETGAGSSNMGHAAGAGTGAGSSSRGGGGGRPPSPAPNSGRQAPSPATHSSSASPQPATLPVGPELETAGQVIVTTTDGGSWGTWPAGWTLANVVPRLAPLLSRCARQRQRWNAAERTYVTRNTRQRNSPYMVYVHFDDRNVQVGVGHSMGQISSISP